MITARVPQKPPAQMHYIKFVFRRCGVTKSTGLIYECFHWCSSCIFCGFYDEEFIIIKVDCVLTVIFCQLCPFQRYTCALSSHFL
jgi:hypothetical protein